MARLIVCERTGVWAVALRREAPLKMVRVYETRSLADCWQMLAGFPSSFVVAELARTNIDSLLDRLCGLERQYPRARVAVAADPSLADYEWLMREAGAVHFLTSRRGAGRLALVARGHLAEAPEAPRGMAERIWAELPWALT